MYVDRARDGGRIALHAAAHPVFAWSLIVCAAFFAALGGYIAIYDRMELWLVLFLTCAVAAGLLGAFAGRLLTPVTATFDGPTRTLTVTRTPPWGERSTAHPFDEVGHVSVESPLVLDANSGLTRDHYVQIAFLDDSNVRLRFHARERDDMDRAAADINALLRRPAA